MSKEVKSRPGEVGLEVEFVKWFSELSNKDILIAGGKGASLSEMYNAKVPVPAGFVVTAQAYAYFIETTGIAAEMKRILSKTNVDDTAALNKASKEVRELIERKEFPKDMSEAIVEAYEMMDVKKDGENALEVLESDGQTFVAIRSSATTEDLADASFAGQQESFLNVKGSEEVLEYARKCMSSLFTPRAIFYRTKKGFPHEKSYLAVVVQKMVNSKKSGVMFSKNPTSNDKSIVIEAVWGLGEGIVSGQIKPDHYVIDDNLDEFTVKDIQISEKKIAIVKNEDGKNETIKLSSERSKKQVLDNYEIKRLAQYARQLEEHYNKPQDIEFAIDEGGIFIVQSRPITTKFKASEAGDIAGEVLLSGLGASPGVSSGTVRIIHDLSELEKIKEGDVLVTEMTNPDMVVSMQKSAAIVTDEGGITSHAAIVSREMGIPAVVGTGDATKKLKDGQVITVDGSSGKVYEGKGETKLAKVEPVVPTRTKIKVIADLPAGAERAAKSNVRAIGLIRLEGIIATGGKHPLGFVKEKKMNAYVELIASNLKKMLQHFDEAWMRSSDIRTDEYKNLIGAPQEDESNPMMGMHGIRFGLQHNDILRAEFEAVREVAKAFPKKKIGLMIPLLIRVEELREAKKIMKEVGIEDNMQIGVMVETPAAVQIIEDLCEEGIDFISFGTNDLTQFTLALDRNNENVASLYDETHPAVKREIQHVIRVCRKYGVETSICGQAGSRPEMAEFLVREGIDSISVNADAARKISELVQKIEANLKDAENKNEAEAVPSISEEEAEDVESEESSEAVGENMHVPVMKQKNVDETDIEEKILAELDEGGDEYYPGSNGDTKKDIPPLNEAMAGGSEMFTAHTSPEEEFAIENALVEESEKELQNEWKGERKVRS